MDQKKENIYKFIIKLFDIYKLNTKNISEISNLGFTLESLKQDKNIDYSLCYIKIISELLTKQLYSEIINFHNNHLTEISENINDDYMLKYNVILGICYQELGKLEVAEGYYNHFLDNISVNKKDITEKLNENNLKFMFLMREIGELGFTYKINRDKYDRYKYNKKKRSNEKDFKIKVSTEERIKIEKIKEALIMNNKIRNLKQEYNIDYVSLSKEFNNDYIKNLPPFIIIITQLGFFITNINPLQVLSHGFINTLIFIIILIIGIFIMGYLLIGVIYLIWVLYLFFIKNILLKIIFNFFKNKKVQMINISQQNIIISLLIGIGVFFSSILLKVFINLIY